MDFYFSDRLIFPEQGENNSLSSSIIFPVVRYDKTEFAWSELSKILLSQSTKENWVFFCKKFTKHGVKFLRVPFAFFDNIINDKLVDRSNR